MSMRQRRSNYGNGTWNNNEWRKWFLRGLASGGTPPSHVCWLTKTICSQEVRANVFTLYSIMNVLGRESMVENLETNFSKSIQIGFCKATSCFKCMQKVFRNRRCIG